ncbi:HypC/HybG/HupF family hydrogenase formation chaperone [Myxococcota bacterium]|nr:HypC/HybG/HupF family hydrogenase formation chaperone [Myxococcota bacterium]
MCLALPGRIETIVGEDPIQKMATVNFSGVKKQICLAYVPEAEVGQYVLVHVGFALNVIDEEEAKETIKTLLEIEAQMEDEKRSV